MQYGESDADNVVSLDKPQRGSKDGYLQLFFISRQQLGRIISDTEFSRTDYRLVIYTKYLISSITDDDIRDQVMKKYQNMITEAKQNHKDNESRYDALVDATMEVLGDITAFYDEFMGVTHRLKVGLVG